MSDDLVKRLRRDAQAARDYLGPPEIAPSISLDDAEDAADRIEAQAAEIERLKRPMDDEEMVAIAKQAATDPLADKAKKWDAAIAISRALGALAPLMRAREAAAFRAGAEAMREAAAKLHDEAAAKLAGGRKRINQFDQYIINVLERKAEEIRALPIGAPT